MVIKGGLSNDIVSKISYCFVIGNYDRLDPRKRVHHLLVLLEHYTLETIVRLAKKLKISYLVEELEVSPEKIRSLTVRTLLSDTLIRSVNFEICDLIH